MKRTEIIELCNQLTERKGEKVLNLASLFSVVVQDICKRDRFWWRRVLVNFTMTIGDPTYDLTDATLFPALKEIAIEEITKFSLIMTPSPLQVAELVPVTDHETLIEMKFNSSNGQPGRYTMDANSYTTILVDPPDQAYNAFIVGWGIANPATDTTTDSVPMIPPWGHNAILAGMMWEVFKWQYGSKNDKSVDAEKDYEQAILDLMQKKRFDPNYKLQLNLAEQAVQST